MTKNLRSIEPTESQIQCAIFEWARITDVNIGKVNKAKIGDYLIKNANEGKRSFFIGKKMKKEGLTAGVLDLFFAFPVRNPFKNSPGAWIEVKSINGKLSKAQEIWIERMKYIGYPVYIVKSVDEGIQAIKDYLGMR